MKTATLLSILILGISIPATLAAALAVDPADVAGTWSGSWVRQGGVLDSVTLELKPESSGKLAGKFLTPVPMDLTKASFSAATGTVIVEAIDEKSGTQYKVNGRIEGNQLKGSLAANNVTGSLHLTKWTFTYSPRP